jgi:hypothetical protein
MLGAGTTLKAGWGRGESRVVVPRQVACVRGLAGRVCHKVSGVGVHHRRIHAGMRVDSIHQQRKHLSVFVPRQVACMPCRTGLSQGIRI